MASMAASTASLFIDMKSTSVLSRSKTMARITAPELWTLFEGLPDRAADGDLAVVDSQVESALGVRAHPRLVADCRALPPVIGQRQQHSFVAFLALWKLAFHPVPLPNGPSSGE